MQKCYAKEKGQANHALTRMQHQLDVCECETTCTDYTLVTHLIPLLQLVLLFDPFSLLAGMKDGVRFALG